MGGSSPPTTTTTEDRSCPETLDATVTGPAPGILPNSWLDVGISQSSGSSSVVVIDPVTGATVGSLAGIRRLATLLRCIREGKVYRAYVDSVSGGRVVVTVTLQ